MNVSVYITCFNQQEFIREAIESVLSQTRQPDQIVIVDDASTDESPAIIRGYEAQYPGRIEVLSHRTNQGVTRSRMDALAAVTGDYVTFLDGDDYFMPSKLEEEVKCLEESAQPVAVYSNYVYVDAEGRTLKPWASPDDRPPQGNVFSHVFSWNLPSRNLFRAELLPLPIWREEGFFDPRLTLYEDFDMRIRLSRRLPYVYCPHILSAYRVTGHGLSDSPAVAHLEALEYIFRKHRRLLAELPSSQRQDTVRRFNKMRAKIATRAASHEMRKQTPLRRLAALKWAARSWQYDPSRAAFASMAETVTPELMGVARGLKRRLR